MEGRRGNFSIPPHPCCLQKDSLRLLSREAEKRRRKVMVHLKVDTGMGRLGVPFSLWPDFLKEVKRFAELEVEGILSHFSMTDEGKGYTQNQWRAFQKAVALAEEVGISCQYLHMASSATLMAFPFYSASAKLVRPGIMLYGSYPSPTFRPLIRLKPVMTLKTHIHFLKRVPSGARSVMEGPLRQSGIASLLPSRLDMRMDIVVTSRIGGRY